MDPYLEPFRLDVHGKLATYVADALNEKLPNDLVASIEERIAIQSESRASRILAQMSEFMSRQPNSARLLKNMRSL